MDYIDNLSWSNTDPRDRYSYTNHIGIIVLTPDDIFSASIETKHGWNIFLNRRLKDMRQIVLVDESWPPEWKWIRGPI